MKMHGYMGGWFSFRLLIPGLIYVCKQFILDSLHHKQIQI